MAERQADDAQERIISELVQDDPDMIDLVEEFVSELPQRLSAMQDALDTQRIEEVRSLAHQLKGSGGGYGYPILTSKAAVLEKQAIDGDIEAIKDGIDELTKIIATVAVR